MRAHQDGKPDSAPVVIHRGSPRWFLVDGLRCTLHPGRERGWKVEWWAVTAHDTPAGDLHTRMDEFDSIADVRRNGRRVVRAMIAAAPTAPTCTTCEGRGMIQDRPGEALVCPTCRPDVSAPYSPEGG